MQDTACQSTIWQYNTLQYNTINYNTIQCGYSAPASKVPHPYSMQTLGGVITIAIVFRTNLSWNRYWEGATHLHFMYSKWADAYSQFCAFVSVSIQKAACETRGTFSRHVPYIT